MARAMIRPPSRPPSRRRSYCRVGGSALPDPFCGSGLGGGVRVMWLSVIFQLGAPSLSSPSCRLSGRRTRRGLRRAVGSRSRYFEESRGFSKELTELALMVLGEVGVADCEHERSLLHSAGRCVLSAGCPGPGTGAGRAAARAGLSGASSQGSVVGWFAPVPVLQLPIGAKKITFFIGFE